MVTMAGKSLTVRCHIASGVPNSSNETPSTRSIARVELRRAANRVQYYRAVLLQRRERLGAHAAFTDDRAHAVTLDDLALIRSSRMLVVGPAAVTRQPPPSFTTTGPQDTHRPAQVHGRLVLHQVRMTRRARERRARDENEVADLERSHSALR